MLRALLMAVAIVGLAGVGALVPINHQAQAQSQSSKPKLTCTRISRECRRECVKEAPLQFCRGYCLDHKEACLKTGRWDGIRRQFTKVTRK